MRTIHTRGQAQFEETTPQAGPFNPKQFHSGCSPSIYFTRTDQLLANSQSDGLQRLTCSFFCSQPNQVLSSRILIVYMTRRLSQKNPSMPGKAVGTRNQARAWPSLPHLNFFAGSRAPPRRLGRIVDNLGWHANNIQGFNAVALKEN